MHSRIVHAILLIAIVLSGSVPDDTHGASAKPLPPVTIVIIPAEPSRIPESTGEKSLTAIIRANVDVPELSVDIYTTNDVEVVKGDLAWKGRLGKSGQHSMHITVHQVRPGKGLVRARVTIGADKGAAYTARAEYSLAGKKQQKRKTAPQPDVVRKDRRGNDVIEHSLP